MANPTMMFTSWLRSINPSLSCHLQALDEGRVGTQLRSAAQPGQFTSHKARSLLMGIAGTTDFKWIRKTPK